jgi:signal transduction histidine kinase
MERAEARMDIVSIPAGIPRGVPAEPDVDAVAASTLRTVRRLLGEGTTAARLVLPDESGRLRLALAEGHRGGSVPGRSSRLRVAFDERRPIRAELLRPRGSSVAVLPLVSSGTSLGVLEVVAPGASIQDQWRTLEAVVSQASISLRHLAEQKGLRRSNEALRHVAGLARELIRAGTPQEVVRISVRSWADRLGLPAAGWLVDDAGGARLVAARGLGPGKRAELAPRPIGETSPGASLSQAAAEAFAEVSGMRDVEAIDAGRAIIVVGGVSEPLREPIRSIQSLLTDVIDHLDAVTWARRRDDDLEAALAMTAHELREPMLAAKAQIDSILYEGALGADHRDMLRRSRKELEALVELAEAMLRWAATGETPPLRRTDLVALVRPLVTAANQDAGLQRVVLKAPESAVVRAARPHLRAAVANIVGNALAYSPPGAQVVVRIAARADVVSISVEDQGPGVDADDVRAIFDPFVRGGQTHRPRNGRGLGLYIARQIVEAHNGRIWLASGSGEGGAMFHIELPAWSAARAEGRVPVSSPRS